MKRAIVIHEDCHGLIGLAANYPLAIDFLIKENWLNGDTEIFVTKYQNYQFQAVLLKEIFPNWQREIKSWTIEKFNTFFCCLFHLESMEVYGVNYWG